MEHSPGSDRHSPQRFDSAKGSAHRPQDKPLLVIGLLGGVASGKSFVADQLGRLGAVVIDADQLAHEVLRFPSVIAAARQRWGEAILDTAGQVNRQALGQIVFGPQADARSQLNFLEELTHPLIGEQAAKLLAEAAENHAPAVVLDAPLLLEAGWDNICDKIVYVDAPHEVRLARARQRGWSDEEFQRREAVQKKLELKRSRAEVIIDNSTSPEATRAQVEQFWQSLLG